MRRLSLPLAGVIALGLAAPLCAAPQPAVRSFEATYVATVQEVPAGLARLEVWVPLPVDSADQTIRNVRVESPYEGSIRREKDNGDAYFYFSTESPKAGPLEIRVRFEAERREAGVGGAVAAGKPSAEELQRYLREEKLVTLSPRIRQISKQVTLGAKTPAAKAKAIYDFIINTMTYDKVAPGWGQGDTERACDVQKGNCTDIHSYFMSLARAQGIPSRFIIGFPLKPEAEGTISGYHCWAEFYLPDRGWVPVDASDASKTMDPVKRAYLFGHLDPDRVQFTIGRELRLDPPPCAETLNYFIYPYAEGDGRAITPVAIRLEYKNRPAASSAISGGS
jgi:transglutaminase-like putative cysteine protease